VLSERMPPAVKFCGLTRREDAAYAVSLGASYTGVIFASGPRVLTEDRAAYVLSDVPSSIGRVGVFGDQSAEEIGRIARRLDLQAVQLHGAMSRERLDAVRRVVDAEVWPVIRVAGNAVPPTALEVIADSNVLFLDSYVPGVQGGSGVALNWTALAATIESVRIGKRLVLAGGLRPANLSQAIAAIGPDIVDVSSGVESAPGIKDHTQMRMFRDAALLATLST
jgi:phosphoribosylanthranilate isomerase